MKKVLILFGKSDWRKARPFSNKDYQYSYEFFYSLCKENGIQMYRASYEWYDYKNHLFKHAWIYDDAGGKWSRVHDIIPDLIYDKTKGRLETYRAKEIMAEHYPFINDLTFTQLIDNKFITGLIFREWSKESVLVRSKSELVEAIKEIPSKRVVLKPVSESGGKGVQIFSKKDVKKISFSGEHIVQEFIDSSCGIPGIGGSTHDLRLVFINEKIMYAYTREPMKGKLLANLAQGGKLTIIPLNKLPGSISPIVSYANKIFSSFTPRIFTIDFMFDENGVPWIVELNSMPGLYFTPSEKPSMVKMYRALLSEFQRAARMSK